MLSISLDGMASKTIGQESLGKKKCNNLICLFDPYFIETINGNSISSAFDFMDALNEKIAPIIVTTNLIENFCYWKANRLRTIRQFLLSSPIGRRFLIKLMNANFDGFDCYLHPHADLVLLIPRGYIADQCGFDLDNLNKLNDLSYAHILQHISNQGPRYNRLIDDFESMFIKNNEQVSPITVWNIFLAGHGSPAPEIKINKSNKRDIVSSIKKVNKRIQELEKQNIDPYQKERSIIEEEKKLQKLHRQLKQMSVQGVSWKKKTSGSIAGLTGEDFHRLMTFFETGIKTSYLHYETCFSGGFNQTLLNQELSLLNTSFIVSTLGINESVTSYSNKSNKFTSFFKKLDALFCNAQEVIGDQELITATVKDSIADILASIIEQDYLDYNQPFVRIPSIGVFKALGIADEVELLSHSVARAHEAEGSAIDYTNSDAKTIFIYPSYISVDLKIKDHVAIVSPVPQSLTEMQKQSIHIFEKIFYKDTLSSIIPNFVSFNTRYQTITFVIKELRCLDGQYLKLDGGNNKPIVIENMIIQISPAKSLQYYPDYYVSVFVDVAFTHNNNNYWISRRIGNVQSNIEKIFDVFEQAKIEPMKAEDMRMLAEEIMQERDIARFEKENKEITLSSMVEYLEEKIGHQLPKKNITNSHNTVLLKKIKKFERITSDASLKMQKAFITKTESMPGVAWIERLEKLEKIAQNVLNQIHIHKLIKDGQGNSILISAEGRIKEIVTQLNKERELSMQQLSLQEQGIQIARDVKQTSGGQKVVGAIQQVKDAVKQVKDAIVHQAKKAYSYITGAKLQKQYRYGYGKPR